MIEFFRSLFGIRSTSGETAKERLRLVLLSDHLSLAPDLVDSLKAELLEVISRYVDIDSGNADITFEHRDREIAMLASVPVTGVRKDVRPRNGNGVHAPAPVVPPAEPVAHVPAVEAEVPAVATELAHAQPSSDALAESPVEVAETPIEAVEPAVEVAAAAVDANEATPIRTPAQSAQAARPRRRRRRRPPPASPAPQGEIALEDIPASNA